MAFISDVKYMIYMCLYIRMFSTDTAAIIFTAYIFNLFIQLLYIIYAFIHWSFIVFTLRFIYIWFYKESIRNFSDFISLSVQWVIIEDLHILGIHLTFQTVFNLCEGYHMTFIFIYYLLHLSMEKFKLVTDGQ